MNIWAWVRETRERLRRGDAHAQRLAQLTGELPSAAVDEAHERVDGMVPEAVALARDLDEPWVELFIRHWNLQSRVLHRRRAGEELREAVSLLDFASGSRTRPCPQSVCAVQDLAVCYAIRDGPGYVPERLAVARETLARIDPSWACFDCISAEYFSALMDDDRPADALAFIEDQLALAAEHGSFEIGFNTTLNRARALAELGRAGEALELVEGVRDPARYGRSRLMTHRQCRVSILLKLGRLDEAMALHPRLSAIIDTGTHLRGWADNLTALVDAGVVPNTARVGRELLTIQEHAEHNSAFWDTALTALIGARLAAARGAREVARMLLDDVDRVIVQLRRPALLDARRREVEDALAALEPRAPAHDEATDDPERALDRLAHLIPDAAPDQAQSLTLERAAALRGVGRASMARALLDAHLRQHGGEVSERVLVELAETLLAAHDHGALEQLLASDARGQAPTGPDTELHLMWLLGQSLRERGELERAISLDRELLERTPEATQVRLRLARAARELGDWATALDALDVAADTLPPGNVDWDRMTAATVLGRWRTVRAAAARLEIPVSQDLGPERSEGVGAQPRVLETIKTVSQDLGPERSEGVGPQPRVLETIKTVSQTLDDEPIDTDLGPIRCEFVEPSGRRQRYWARRTSPCGARIIEIAMPSDPQHFRDRVVFEPSDLDSHLREAGGRHRVCFEVVSITEPGGYRSFLLRGFDPGEARLEALRGRVHELGCGFERITGEGRSAADPRLSPDPGPGPEVPTVAVLIALPTDADPRRLRRALLDSTADWELPLLDPMLDEAAGERTASERATALLQRWKP